MAVMDIQVSARRSGTVSVSEGVAAAHRVIAAAGLKSVLHPMGTCVEGDPARLYRLAAEIHEALIGMRFERIAINIKVDHRLDREQSMEEKLRRVDDLLAGQAT
jgi:uncharacterized protein (TIGR00106 family)